jgi:hypothetical protein
VWRSETGCRARIPDAVGSLRPQILRRTAALEQQLADEIGVNLVVATPIDLVAPRAVPGVHLAAGVAAVPAAARDSRGHDPEQGGDVDTGA